MASHPPSKPRVDDAEDDLEDLDGLYPYDQIFLGLTDIGLTCC